MLKQFITLMFLCVISIVYAQEPKENYTLNSTETGTKKYVARDYISLKNGFSYKAGEGLTFTASIDPCLLFPPTDATYKTESGSITTDPAQGGVVGTIEGSLDVSSTGSLSYDIPLKMVPGTSGVAPSLSIGYNSQGPDGIMGQGFYLNGLSAIKRVSKNYFNDDIVSGIDYYSNDNLALDGNKLINIGRKNGVIEYRTENNNFTKVIAYYTTSHAGDYDYLVSKFVVYTKDGLIKEYGFTDDSKVEVSGSLNIHTWLLNKVTDTKGNYYTVTYKEDNDNGYCIPSRIDYTGNDNTGLTTYASYQFTYSYRWDQSVKYLGGKIKWKNFGSKHSQKYLLKGIKNYYGDELVWKYDISYNNGSSTTKKSTVSSITLTNRNNEKFNPLTFKYDYSIPPMQNVNYDKSYYATNFLTHDSKIYNGDFNGDGITDVVTIADKAKGATWKDLKLFLGKSDGTGFTYKGTTDLDQLGCYDSDHTIKDILVGDFNGDGKSDIIVQDQEGTTKIHLHVMLKNESGFTKGDSYLLYSNKYTANQFFVCDINADGLSDFYHVKVKDYNGYSDNVYFYINKGEGVLEKEEQYLWKSCGYLKCNIGDFNGDGLADLFLRKNDGYDIIYPYFNSDKELSFDSSFNGGTWPTLDHDIVFGDFNGDNMTDFVAYGYKDTEWSNWSVNHSTGDDFNRTYFSRKRDAREDKVFLGDFNGDGITDLLFMADEDKGGDWEGRELYLGNKNGVGFTQTDEGPLYPSLGQRFNFGDFNGDGVTDFFIVDDKSPYWEGYQLYHAGRVTPELVTGIVNGYGEEIDINYEPLTNSEVYSKSSNANSYPVQQVQAPFFVVSEINTEDGIGGTRTTQYNYKGLKVHLKGKGILGFDEFTVKDVEKDISSTTYYGYDPNNYVVYETGSTTFYKSNIKLSETSIVNDVSKDENGVITHYASQSSQKEWDLDGSLKADVVNTYEYDNFGNITLNTIIQGASSNYFTTKIVNTYYNDESKWYLGRLTKTEVTKTLNGKDPITNVSTFGYDASDGILRSETVEPNNSKYTIHKEYTLDDYGNIKKISNIREWYANNKYYFGI